MHRCTGCGRDIDRQYRFCPWCAEPQRTKLVELFPAHPAVEADHGKVLRASRYLDDPEVGPHVRISMWNAHGVAQAALSLDPQEVSRLARFLRTRDTQEHEAVAAEDATVALEHPGD
jgi:hypothetical protein